MTRTFVRAGGVAAVLATAALALAGCGGGGGGGATATISGKVMLIGVGGMLVPNPAATVKIDSGPSVQTSTTDGSFVLQGVPAGSQKITVMAASYQTLTQNLPPLTAGTNNDLGTLFLSDTGYTATASGTVVRSDNGQAVSGAKVYLNGQMTVTSGSGLFSFGGLPEGLGGQNVDVGIIKSPDPTQLDDKPIQIFPMLGASPPNNDLGVIQMSPPVSGIPGGPTDINGVVSLQGQTDKSLTSVSLLSGAQVVATVVTGADGSYGFWVAAGTYTVKAEHTGFQTKSQDVTLTSPDKPVTLNLTLAP